MHATDACSSERVSQNTASRPIDNRTTLNTCYMVACFKRYMVVVMYYWSIDNTRMSYDDCD